MTKTKTKTQFVVQSRNAKEASHTFFDSNKPFNTLKEAQDCIEESNIVNTLYGHKFDQRIIKRTTVTEVTEEVLG